MREKQEIGRLIKDCMAISNTERETFELCEATLVGGEINFHVQELQILVRDLWVARTKKDGLLGVRVAEKRALSQKEREKRIEWLRSRPRHAQRSTEWYAFRQEMITMSDLYKVMSGPGTQKQLLTSKVSPPPSSCSSSKTPPRACLHGIKYEPVVQKLYELRFSTTLEEFGCIQHANLSILGASPDGVNVDPQNKALYGRLVEIKCPLSRKLQKGEVPEKYAIQVQGQLECLNLEECDYVEMVFEEHEDETRFLVEESTTLPPGKGIVVQCVNMENVGVYFYSDVQKRPEEQVRWAHDMVQMIVDTREDLCFQRTIFWTLVDENIVLIRRNRAWFAEVLPQIQEFWNKVQISRTLPSCPQQLSPPPPVRDFLFIQTDDD